MHGRIDLFNIVFASRNEGKIGEVKAILEGTGVNLLALNNYSGIPEIIEDGETFLENALKKARTVSRLTGEAALADDSGLSVDALDGAPGIYSSRYAGENATDARNVAKLLQDLKDVPPGRRGATFVCVLVLYCPDGRHYVFQGKWRGEINYEPAGSNGFGYDPVFYLPDRGLTAAQLPSELKNTISHRGLAFRRLKEALAGGRISSCAGRS